MGERDEYGFLPPIDYDVTCRTEGCENLDITIRVPADPVAPLVVCGACGQQITDPVPVEPEPEPEVPDELEETGKEVEE